jgi:septum formation protein
VAQKEGVHTLVVLASASPRRRALLEAAGVAVSVLPAHVDETPAADEAPAALVVRLARAKAAAAEVGAGGRGGADAVVVAADTTVALGSSIFNKPVDDVDAERMLRALSGRTHEVFTGWCVRRGDMVEHGVVATRVTFRTLDDSDIASYLATGEHRDKAGAYGIQGAAAVLVDRVEGSLTSVIGLPVGEVLGALRRLASRGGA